MRRRHRSYPWEQEREGIRGPLLVRRQPVGVVGAIVPWNFPLALSFPKLAPALLTGSSVVLKPPVETPLFGFLLAEVFDDAGLPPGVLNIVPADREVERAAGQRTRWSTRSASPGAQRRAAGSPRCAASRSSAAASSSAASRPPSCCRMRTSTP